MPFQPLKQWKCDACGKLIENISDGWFECEYDGSHVCDFRIIHQSCQSGARRNLSDSPLEHFIGELGMIQMLGMVDHGKYLSPEYKGPKVKDFREWSEMFRRLFVPHYEEARLYFDKAVSDGFFDTMNELNYFQQDTLKQIIERYAE